MCPCLWGLTPKGVILGSLGTADSHTSCGPRGCSRGGSPWGTGRRVPGNRLALNKKVLVCHRRRSSEPEGHSAHGRNHTENICQSRSCNAFFKEFTSTRLENSALPASEKEHGPISLLDFSVSFSYSSLPDTRFFWGPTYYIWISAKPIMRFSVFLFSELVFFFSLKKMIYYQTWQTPKRHHGMKFNIMMSGVGVYAH